MFGSIRVFLALDGLEIQDVQSLVVKLGSRVGYKIHDLWDRFGPNIINALRLNHAEQVLVDLKLHDIPSTVKLRAQAVKLSGASGVTVHASGGIPMMRAAVSVQDDAFAVVAITALTSLSEEEIHLTFGHPAKASVILLAQWAKLAGVRGVVCSPREVGILSRREELQDLCFVTPGVRSLGKDAAAQKRIDTPANAVKAGAMILVVGREIVHASDPVAALVNLEQQIAAATIQPDPTKGA